MVSPKLSWKKKNVHVQCIVCKLFLTVWETWVTNIPCTLPSDLGLFYPQIYVHYSLVEFKLLRCKNITKHYILNIKCIHYFSVKLFVVHPVMVYISEGFLANIMYMGLFKHCKPTCIRSDFISWFTGDKLVHGSLFSRSRCILSGEKKLRETFENWFTVRNYHDDKVLMNLAKISHV